MLIVHKVIGLSAIIAVPIYLVLIEVLLISHDFKFNYSIIFVEGTFNYVIVVAQDTSISMEQCYHLCIVISTGRPLH